MDFFKSVFSSDPDPPAPPRDQLPPSNDPLSQEEGRHGADEPEPVADSSNRSSAIAGGGAWSFGGLLKTITSKSETVIQTYRRDLEEFGSGLRKETVAIREAATKVVRDLPGSLEAGASVAQESLETVGQAIDDLGGTVWRGTAEIISHGKEALLSLDTNPNSDSFTESVVSQSNLASASLKKLSRFDAQVIAIQSEPGTFTMDPEDLSDFGQWKLGFRLEDKEEDIESLLYESNALEGLFEKLVPAVVDRDTFWTLYFYRVYKLRQAEDARANLVKRVISREDEEEDLSWEVDDDDDDGRQHPRIKEIHDDKDVEQGKELKFREKEAVDAVKAGVPENLGASEASSDEKKSSQLPQDEYLEAAVETSDGKQDEDEITRYGDQLAADRKVETSGSSKDSDFSIVSSQPPLSEEDDLGWDEIEDLGVHNDKKVSTTSGVFVKSADLQKKLPVTVDEEDLTWDIED